LQRSKFQERDFREKLDSKLSGQSEDTTAWAQVCDAMNEVAEEVLGLDEPVRNEWFDDNCRAVVQAVIKARAEGRETRSKDEKSESYRERRRSCFE
jgi:hypothetical protein